MANTGLRLHCISLNGCLPYGAGTGMLSRVRQHFPRLSMTHSFFPRDQWFWRFHAVAVIAIVIITLLTFQFWGELSLTNVISSLIWCLPYSAAVLGFRYLFLTRDWQQLAMAKLVSLSIAYGSLTAVLVVVSVALFSSLMLWIGPAGHDPSAASAGLSLRMLTGGALQAQLFICIWIFIYISVTSARRIKDTELRNLRLQNTLKEAQLSSLSNQLNPHFLFNALNNIRFMMHENTRNADEMVLALSEILRYSLASSHRDKVGLQEELNIIERYLALMKIQMEERLQIRISVSTSLYPCLLPPMILQMLIENAIKHGIEQIPEGGLLSLHANEQADSLIFTISNDLPAGYGNDKPAATLGIGLENIRKRITLLYGSKAVLSVHVQETPPEKPAFAVLLQIPKEIRR